MGSTQAEDLALREALEKARQAKEESARVEKFAHDAKHKILPGLQKKRYTMLNAEMEPRVAKERTGYDAGEALGTIDRLQRRVALAL